MSNETIISPMKELLKSAIKWTAIIAAALGAWVALSALLDHIIT